MPSATRVQTLASSFTPVANFAYQLECVSGLMPQCAGREDYLGLWRSSFGIDPDNSPLIKRWLALRKKHEAKTEPKNEGVPDCPCDRIYPPHRVLTAGLTARDLADYQSRLALVLPDASVAEASAVVRELYRPFAKWWTDKGEATGRARADAFAQALASDKLGSEVRAM